MHGLAIEQPPAAPPSGAIGAARILGNSVDRDAGTSNAPRSLASKIAWSATGFLLGAAFWHFVGFWSFVSYAVLGGPGPDESVIASRLVTLARAEQASTPLRTPARSSCITLALDRTTGQTRPEPCDVAVALPLADSSGREDLAFLPDRETPTISPQSAPDRTTVSRDD